MRTPEEFVRGHVPGAVNIGIDELAQRHLEGDMSGWRAAGLPTDR